MKPVEEFTDPAAFRAAVAKASGKGRAKPKAKVATVSSEPGQGDQLAALGRLAVYGFMPRYRAGIGHDCWNPRDGRSTTAHASYRAAVIAAEREVRE